MKRRFYNIFAEDSKTFVLAMDHGVVMDVGEMIASPEHVIKESVAGGIDAILTSYGVATQFCKAIGNKGLILRVDGGTTVLHPNGVIFDRLTQAFRVEDAIKIGADGIMCMGWLGVSSEEVTIRNLANYASECNKYGLVFGAEMIPGGFGDEDIATLENIAFSNRLGAEYGADFIKSPFTGEATEFRDKVVNTCFKPIVVLGGGANRSDLEILSMVHDAMEAGCKGVVIGRSIWRHKRIRKLCRAISGIIHENFSIEKGMEILA